MTHTETQLIVAMVGVGLVGIIIGLILCGGNPKAFDPCDKPKDDPYYKIEPYDERNDAAMQFHWQDHQPSLHPR